MPLYEYRCGSCGLFEVWRSLSEVHLAAHCPTCQQPGKRIFSPPILLSGSLRLRQTHSEPQIVQRNLEPKQPGFTSRVGNRPWMISH